MSRLTDFFPSAGGKENALLIMVGGGGGASMSAPAICGAAGGNILCTFLNLKNGVTCPIVVGAGGAAGCTAAPCQGQPGGAGSDGGYSSFGELRAPGGGGGYTCLLASNPAPCGGGTYITSIGVGGIGAYGPAGVQSQQMIRALPLSYPGYVGNIARQKLNNFPEPFNGANITVLAYNAIGIDYGTILYLNKVVENCPMGNFPIACAIPTCPPACTTVLGMSCRVVCSSFYDVELTGQPYSGCYFISSVPTPAAPIGDVIQFDISNNSVGCSRYGGGGTYTCLPCNAGYSAVYCNCASIPNNPNTGHAGRMSGCNGDSGVVVLFYPTSIPAASSFPGGTDCTPVSCPFGMRAYKFTTSGSITI